MAGLGLAALAGAGVQGSEAAVPDKALQVCAAIDAPTDRLTCYDQLAGRKVSSNSVMTPAAPGTTAAAGNSSAAPGTTAAGGNSSAAAGTATAVGNSSAAPGTAAAVGSPSAVPSAPAPSALAPPPKEAFGLYRAEHPVAPQGAPSLTAQVVSLAVAANGRPTVSLEGGGVWELAESDPVLSRGDTVTIDRAALGSFLMTTPSGRTHRVKRLR